VENITDVKVKSLYKALSLLDYFNSENPERGITELAELSGMLKSSVHNIISTFEKCGYVKKNQKTGKYTLYHKVLELSHAFYLSNNFVNTLKTTIQKFCDEIGETIYLGSISETNVIYIDSYSPPNSLPEGNIIGYKAPLYCTGLGKAMLAYRSEAEIQAVIDAGLTAFTPNTITDGASLKKNLAEIVKRGYSIDDMEHEYGIRCVSVPIKNKNGECLMAISVKGPSLRMTDDKLAVYAKRLIEIIAKTKDIT